MKRTMLVLTMVAAGCGGKQGDGGPDPTLTMAWEPAESSIVGPGSSQSVLKIRGTGLPDTLDVMVCDGLFPDGCLPAPNRVTGCADGECEMPFGLVLSVGLTLENQVIATVSAPVAAEATWMIHISEQP